ncbi:unnamed protein product [Malus baccata var. baccata]
MEGDGIWRLKKLFHALIAVLTLLQCVNSSPALGSNNISSGGVMRCIEREREALLAIKQKLVDDYNVLSSWGREEHKQDCCKWVGVHCSNRNNHVTQLNLGWERLDQAYSLQQKGDPQEIKYYLQGMMSPKLIELQHLKYLDLSEINFHGGQLPDFVGNLSNLRHLDLSRASFGGRVPSQVGNLTHLQFLDLSYNAFANVENLNSWLPLLSSLTYLDLSYNNLRNVPDWLEIVNNHPKLTNLTLTGCGLSSPPIHSSTLFNMNSSKSLAHVDLSENQLTSPSIFLWLSNYNASLVHLDLSSNSLTGLIPQVLGNMSSLVYLSISDNHLSGSIPNLTNFSSLKGLSLYENQLRGTIHESIGQMSNLEYMYLDMNALEGVVSESHFSNLSRLTSLYLSSNSLALSFNSNWVPPFQLDSIFLASCKMGPYFPKWLQTQNPSFLDLSNNKISGSISILCEAYKGLRLLNLSSNNLSGELPECLSHLGNLVILDLSYNAFSGRIPATVGSLYHMRSLNLRSNKFVGELPSSFKNCTNLQIIDVGDNKLSGHIPKWLGVSLQNLFTLVLSSNNFNGSMPPELCHLTNIQILDVSVNNISGTIPKCLSTLTVLAQKGNSSPTRQYQINDTLADMHQTLEFKNTLGFLTRIDFSSNRLTGAIPSEITDLVGLVSLNLSRNKLTSELPVEIGKLQSLVALDLSRNQINGRIPTSLAQIEGLDVLYLSYNNFIGEIPTTKLQSFDPSVYAGNPQLCGPPLQNMCGDEEEKNEPITWGFYVSMGLGFIVGFWGVFGSLIFVRPWRYSYFKFLNVLNDWFYVKVVLIKRHFS